MVGLKGLRHQQQKEKPHRIELGKNAAGVVCLSAFRSMDPDCVDRDNTIKAAMPVFAMAPDPTLLVSLSDELAAGFEQERSLVVASLEKLGRPAYAALTQAQVDQFTALTFEPGTLPDPLCLQGHPINIAIGVRGGGNQLDNVGDEAEEEEEDQYAQSSEESEDDGCDYEVDKIMEREYDVVNSRWKCKVHYSGYGDDENRWCWETDLEETAPLVLAAFRAQHAVQRSASASFREVSAGAASLEEAERRGREMRRNARLLRAPAQPSPAPQGPQVMPPPAVHAKSKSRGRQKQRTEPRE